MEEANFWGQLRYGPRAYTGGSWVNATYAVGDGEQLDCVTAEEF